MGSSHHGEQGLGNGRSGSSRKAKKNQPEKPKQPQRGLGVAQLEKIRLHNQMMAGYLPPLQPPFHSNFNKKDERENLIYQSSSSTTATTSASMLGLHLNTMMGFGDIRRRGITYDGFQPSVSHNTDLLPHFPERPLALPLLEQTIENRRRHDRRHSMGSISQDMDSRDSQELDLELRLSL